MISVVKEEIRCLESTGEERGRKREIKIRWMDGWMESW